MKDIKSIIADPNFISLPDTEKIKVMLKVDPNFSNLSKEDQFNVVTRLNPGNKQPKNIEQTQPQSGIQQPEIPKPITQQSDITLPDFKTMTASILDRFNSGKLNQNQLEAFNELKKRGMLDMPTAALSSDVPIPNDDQTTMGEKFKGMAEVVGTMVTGAMAEPISGFAGMAGTVLPGKEGQGADWTGKTQQAMTMMPKSEVGQKYITELGKMFEKLPNVSKLLGDFAFDMTGSPMIAAIAATTPTLVSELLGLKVLKSLKTGTKLLDSAGKPTKLLRKTLFKEGIDYDSLSAEAKRMIPEKIEPGLFKTDGVKSPVENVIIEQIKAGGKEDSLAGLKVVDGALKNDPLGNKAIKQGFSPGFVQAIKSSNPATKAKMAEMSNIMNKIKKNERLALDMRPSDIIGDSISERIDFIRGNADIARKNLDTIAETSLKGKMINTDKVMNTLTESLGDLDVRLKTDPSGANPVPNFNGSLISKDRSSQKVIKDLVSLMAEGGEPDALRLHKLKRQLDIMIDFNKKSAMGLSDAGKKVLKKIRYSLNDVLRDSNPDYALTNDVLSKSIGALEDFDKSVGTIDIFGKGSNKAIGQKMRALLSNQQGRVKLENALDGINEVTKSFGGKFDDDIRDLILFSDGLDKRFGTTAKTSFAGQITQATEEAARQVEKPISNAGVIGVGIKIAGKGVEKLRGINDFNAFESLNSLLK